MLLETSKMVEDKGQRVPRTEDFLDRGRVRFVGPTGEELHVDRVIVSWED